MGENHAGGYASYIDHGKWPAIDRSTYTVERRPSGRDQANQGPDHAFDTIRRATHHNLVDMSFISSLCRLFN
jgi:hypothetical protein